MKIVIGIVGQPSSGKGTVSTIIDQCAVKAGISFSHYRSRDILKDTLDLWNIESERANLQILARVMTAKDAFQEGALSRALLPHLTQATTDIVISDGMRWQSDEEMLRAIPNSLILYVTADVKVRYERLKKRAGVGEKDKTWEEFLAEEKASTEVYIPTFGSHADYKVTNDGTLEELVAQIEEFFQKLVVPKLQ
jgi:dephospho-CoA kinase